MFLFLVVRGIYRSRMSGNLALRSRIYFPQKCKVCFGIKYKFILPSQTSIRISFPTGSSPFLKREVRKEGRKWDILYVSLVKMKLLAAVWSSSSWQTGVKFIDNWSSWRFVFEVCLSMIYKAFPVMSHCNIKCCCCRFRGQQKQDLFII